MPRRSGNGLPPDRGAKPWLERQEKRRAGVGGARSKDAAFGAPKTRSLPSKTVQSMVAKNHAMPGIERYHSPSVSQVKPGPKGVGFKNPLTN